MRRYIYYYFIINFFLGGGGGGGWGEGVEMWVAPHTQTHKFVIRRGIAVNYWQGWGAVKNQSKC